MTDIDTDRALERVREIRRRLAGLLGEADANRASDPKLILRAAA